MSKVKWNTIEKFIIGFLLAQLELLGVLPKLPYHKKKFVIKLIVKEHRGVLWLVILLLKK